VYIYFTENLLLFPTAKEFSKSVNTKSSTPRFFLRHSVYFKENSLTNETVQHQEKDLRS